MHVRRCTLLLVGLLAIGPGWSLIPDASLGAAQRRANGPNVIVIFADDQGTLDLNCYGSTDLVTPYMDSLAGRGVRFTQFYAAAPVCSPSRAGLLTGRYPVHAGVPGNVSSSRGHAGMSSTEVTIAEMLKAAGYVTAHIGKWHLGYTPETMPNNQGFDHSFGHMGGCIDNYSHFFYWNGPNRHDLHRNGTEIHEDGKFFPDLMVDEACRFIEENRERAFFIYYAVNTPHYPYQGEAKWLEHYADLEYPRNLYAAFISTQDERLGRLLKKIDELGLRDDTIIIFQSDHGHSTEERAHFGGGNAGPYRGAKFSLFEGGIRVPAIISWPGRIPQGEVRDQVAHSCDWLPTIADLCGVSLLEPDIDGKSLRDVICSPLAASPHDVVHWQVGRGKNPQWAVRAGDWKLIGNPKDTSKKAPITKADRLFLVNLSRDETEMRNLAGGHPAVVERLKREHDRWVGSVERKLAERKTRRTSPVPKLTSLENPAVRYRVPNEPYVVLRRAGVEAVVVDNSAVDDEVLPGHRGGYSGVASLKSKSRQENLFVPFYAGLNFEHIHDGTVKDREILFEPRNAPMELRWIDAHTVELYQAPTPHYKLESCTRYRLLEDGAIEMTFECIPRARTFETGYIGLFWASYIHQPESLDVHFRGHGGEDSQIRWIRGVTPSHGTCATHLAAGDTRVFPHDASFPLTLVFNRSPFLYDEPWYYGVSHGMAFVYMFRKQDQIRFAQSPSGGGRGNPAWDFQFFISDYEVGERSGFVMRAMYCPYESVEQVIRVTEKHRSALHP